MAEQQRAHRLGRHWTLVMPGVILPHLGTLDPDRRLVAGQLWAGPTAALTGLHALQRYGLAIDPGGPATYLVPASARTRKVSGARTVRTTRGYVVVRTFEAVRLVSADRALADAARLEHADPAQIEAWTIACLQRGWTVPVRVEREIWSSRTNGMGPVRAGLAAFAGGAWSKPEASLIRLVASSQVLPTMVTNRVLRDRAGTRLGRPDGYFEDVGLAVQVHSKAHHSGVDPDGTDQWVDTVEKDGAMTSRGVIVAGVTPTSLASRPAAVLRRLEDTYRQHVGRTPPDVVVDR